MRGRKEGYKNEDLPLKYLISQSRNLVLVQIPPNSLIKILCLDRSMN